MRRLATCWVLGMLGWVLAAAPVASQLYRPSGNSTPAPPPTLTHISGQSHPAAAEFGVNRFSPPPAQPHRQPQHSPAQPPSADGPERAYYRGAGHHAHFGRGSGAWWGGTVGYPGWYGWSPLYTPWAYPSYPSVAFLPSTPIYSTPIFSSPVISTPAVSAPPAAAPAAAPVPSAPADVPRGQPKVTNPEQKAKAGKFISFGDGNFASQKYLAALGRYKTAAQIAPDLAEPQLRQGAAHVALGQYDAALKAFRRALRINPDAATSNFRLEVIYVGDPLAKTTHLENLAKAVEANPFNSDLLALMGIELHFDGQPDRAALFFQRSAQLGGNDDHLLDGFLPKPAPAGVPANPGKVVF